MTPNDVNQIIRAALPAGHSCDFTGCIAWGCLGSPEPTVIGTWKAVINGTIKVEEEQPIPFLAKVLGHLAELMPVKQPDTAEAEAATARELDADGQDALEWPKWYACDAGVWEMHSNADGVFHWHGGNSEQSVCTVAQLDSDKVSTKRITAAEAAELLKGGQK